MRDVTKLVVLQLLRAYKWAISPMFPPSCRYVPTCSEYAMEAIDHHGVLRGGFKALMRLLRCHPFVRGGYDPVESPLKPKAGLNGAPSVNRLTTADEPLTTHDRAWQGNL